MNGLKFWKSRGTNVCICVQPIGQTLGLFVTIATRGTASSDPQKWGLDSVVGCLEDMAMSLPGGLIQQGASSSPAPSEARVSTAFIDCGCCLIVLTPVEVCG